jgi:argininosuccinate lyase
MSALWGGRFTSPLDEAFTRFNQSLPFDRKLLAQDIAGSRAFALGLQDINVLSEIEYQKIDKALLEILDDVEKDALIIDKAIHEGVEDIHSFIESQLAQKIGDLAYKANTGRSRNEQVATSGRLWVREATERVINYVKLLQESLCLQAENHVDTVLIGYTHMQRAQPVTWGHYLLSFVEMLQRDIERFEDSLKRVNICPLGSGALAGNSWGIDRQLMSDFLEFRSISKNSLDSTSDRDFVIEFLSTSNLLSMHLSRLAEDMVLYSTTEFATVQMSDQVTTGSSLMPQKKNPDAMELIRGKTGRVYGHLTALLTMTKGLPSCYNKDMQEDKEALFDTAETIIDCLVVAEAAIKTMIIKPSQNVEQGYITATELADYLAKREIPFRQAHHIVGQVVVYAIEQGKEFSELSLGEFRKFSSKIDASVFEVLAVDAAINAKDVVGGTAVGQVRRQLEVLKNR